MTLPLHAQIRTEIEQQILSGALAPGDRLPTEQALMQTYCCARMTVNKALSALAASGLIDRRKKAGSFVTRPRVHSMVLDIPDLGLQISARGQSYCYQLQRRAVHRGTPDHDLDIGSGRVLELDGIHLADGVPIAVEHRRISLQAVPAAESESFADEAPGSWLLHHVPWTEAETRISATGADRAIADLLGVDVASPCLLIDRRTWRGEERVTAVRQYFLGSAYDLVARFGPASSRSG